MNPFELDGAQFLLLFMPVAAVATVVALAVTRRGEPTEPPRMNWSDPYQIACLRAGPVEVIRVAVASLLRRQLLVVSGATLTAVSGAAGAVSRPIERAILRVGTAPTELGALVGQDDVLRAARGYLAGLASLGLAEDQGLRRERLGKRLLVLSPVLLLGSARLIQALVDERANVGFLVGTMLAALLLTVTWKRPRRTPAGDRLLFDLRELFAGLRQRVNPGAVAGAEGELLDAVFGLGSPRPAEEPGESSVPVASAGAAPLWASCGSTWDGDVRERGTRADGGAGSTSCGSSGCGSSSSDGGGSSCGGGGGGCGGCGGD